MKKIEIPLHVLIDTIERCMQVTAATNIHSNPSFKVMIPQRMTDSQYTSAEAIFRRSIDGWTMEVALAHDSVASEKLANINLFCQENSIGEWGSSASDALIEHCKKLMSEVEKRTSEQAKYMFYNFMHNFGSPNGKLKYGWGITDKLDFEKSLRDQLLDLHGIDKEQSFNFNLTSLNYI